MCAVEAISVNDHQLEFYPFVTFLQFYVGNNDYRLLPEKIKMREREKSNNIIKISPSLTHNGRLLQPFITKKDELT